MSVCPHHHSLFFPSLLLLSSLTTRLLLLRVGRTRGHEAGKREGGRQRPMLGRRRLAVADSREGETMAPPTAGARREGGRPMLGRWPTREKGRQRLLLPRGRGGRERKGGWWRWRLRLRFRPLPPPPHPPVLPARLPPSVRLPTPALPHPKQAQPPMPDDGHHPAVTHHCPCWRRVLLRLWPRPWPPPAV
jgi:hypothetical protein